MFGTEDFSHYWVILLVAGVIEAFHLEAIVFSMLVTTSNICIELERVETMENVSKKYLV